MAIGLTLLASALKKVGAGQIAGQLLTKAGSGLIGHISEKIGIPPTDPAFDAVAAEYAKANAAEMNRHQEAMEGFKNDRFEMQIGDVQDARRNEKTDFWNTMETMFMVFTSMGLLGGCLVFFVGYPFFVTEKGVPHPEWVKTMIPMLIGFFSREMLGLRTAFKWGSTEGSSKKNETINAALKREQTEPENTSYLPPSRPVAIAPPVAVVAPPVAESEDDDYLVEGSMEEAMASVPDDMPEDAKIVL